MDRTSLVPMTEFFTGNAIAIPVKAGNAALSEIELGFVATAHFFAGALIATGSRRRFYERRLASQVFMMSPVPRWNPLPFWQGP